MRSFLEYVFRKLLGPPVSGSCWRCPRCDSKGPSLSVLPPKGDYRIRFKCHRCEWWGDAHDLMIQLGIYPEPHQYPRRCDLLVEWQREYERLKKTDAPFSNRGPKRTTAMRRTDAIERAFDELMQRFLDQPLPGWVTDNNLDSVYLLVLAADIAYRNGCSPEALAGKCAEHLQTYRHWLQQDASHLSECIDPD